MATGRFTLKSNKIGFGIPGVKHIFLVVLLIIYTLFGAYIMILLEEPADTKKKLAEYESQMLKYEDSIKHHKQLEHIYEELYVYSDHQYPLGPLWTNLQTLLYYNRQSAEEAFKWHIKSSNIPKPQLQVTEWNLWEAIFYVTSLYTTIGFGNLSPATEGGRWLTMFYAILGIPLVLLVLNDWGNLFFRLICSMWNKLQTIRFCAICFRKKKVKDTSKKDVDEEKDIKNIPFLLAAFICIGYIFMCAAIFQLWEDDWNYFLSFYFFFISLTTIGLGDVMPKHVEYSVCGGILILFGLAVVSMCLNVIQAKLDAIFKDLAVAIDRKSKDRLANQETDNASACEDSVESEQSWQQRLFYQMMNAQKKQMLKEQMEKKRRLRNKRIQTDNDIDEMSTQTDDVIIQPLLQMLNGAPGIGSKTSQRPMQTPRVTTEVKRKMSRKRKSEVDKQTNVTGTQTTEEVDDLYIWNEMKLI